MWFVSVEIENYKSFLKSKPIPFTEGFNVIVGKNNAGKSALVEMLSLHASLSEHRSLKNKSQPTDPVSDNWLLDLAINVSKEEFDKHFDENGNIQINSVDPNVLLVAQNFIKDYKNKHIPTLMFRVTPNHVSPGSIFDFDGRTKWSPNTRKHPMAFRKASNGDLNYPASASLRYSPEQELA
ncbi:MAG: AAA family ATPase [Anaerolineae bacterium]|nr:AAA family ATPase [Anaerolineae bacterium]